MTLRSITTALLGLGLSAGLIGAPAFAAETARPGTLNYIEGAASIDGQQLNSKQIGNISLEPGQELATADGRAEVLLTPGVFLRVDKNSAVKMISPDILQTQVQVDKGRVGVEVDDIHDENNLQIIDAGVTTRLEKTGYYEFNADNPEVEVFKGKADVQVPDGKDREVKGHHDLLLAANNIAGEKPASFNAGKAEDPLFHWSKLRSQYLAEANNEMASDYAGEGYGPGWYWNPYGLGYTFIGGGPFYSPFGWGFYPLGWGWGGGWYGGGWYGGRVYRGGHPYYHGGYGHLGVGHGHPGGGFHGGAGGFHGGAGGFHGGTAGGFHGGGHR